MEVASTGPRVRKYQYTTVPMIYNLDYGKHIEAVILLEVEFWGCRTFVTDGTYTRELRMVFVNECTCPTFVLVPPFAVLFHPTLAGRELN